MVVIRPGSTGVHKHALHPQKNCLHPQLKKINKIKKFFFFINMIKIIKYLLTKQIVMKPVTISIKYRWDISIQHHSDCSPNWQNHSAFMYGVLFICCLATVRSVGIYFCCRKQFHSFIWLNKQTNHNLLSIIIINSTFTSITVV